ncbi:MAG: fatty acid desaturase [Solirubrobacteraceae bacterium]
MNTTVIDPNPGLDAAEQRPPQQPAVWRERLAPYATPCLWRSGLVLLTSVVTYFAVEIGMVLSVHHVGVWLTLLLAPVSAAFLLRTYIVFHDCAHGSFLRSRRGNLWLGRVMATIVLTPFARWRHEHAVHHNTAGDLDKRGIGDVPLLTVAEYMARSPRSRMEYRLLRNPLIMFGLGPIVAMMIGPRLIGRDAPARMRRSVLWTDAVLAVIFGLLGWWLGPVTLALVWTPPALIAGAAGVWLFYVQHNFEGAYWQRTDGWGYADAALQGSSFLKLPRPLQFATGNIGFHHVHHLNVRIPNYNLERAHVENTVFHSVPVLTTLEGMRAVRLKLWDEQRGRMVTFAEANA